MKITIKNYDITYTVETDYKDVQACDAFELVVNLLKQIYHPDNIDNAICDKADELNGESLSDFLTEEYEEKGHSEAEKPNLSDFLAEAERYGSADDQSNKDLGNTQLIKPFID